MKLSYQWLSEYVDLTGISPEQLAEKLTRAGLEVDEVVSRNLGVRGVVVGEVVECVPHPNADRLRVCQVNVGAEALLTIVCGAPNVAAGQRVVTAVPGAGLPGGAIGIAKLRGIESQGMLCSAKEIGLAVKLLPKEQTEGLYILPADAPLGQDVVAYLHLDDVVLDIGLTPNRSDCLSMRGFAYEVAALYNRPVKFPEDAAGVDVGGATPIGIRLETELCNRYEAQVLTGLQTASSPLWMQMRLMAMGVRPISLIVDITNYVMLEWGQPLHAFDLDEVHGGTIIVRQARPGEHLVTLDGEDRLLTDSTIVIADPDRAIGIAGVMGGGNSEITAKTNRVVLESAQFDAVSVRKTGQRFGVRSEAQQRFEKGIDAVAVRAALERATQLLVELAGGARDGGIVAAGLAQSGAAEGVVVFSPDRCNQWLGTQIPTDQMRDAFERLKFRVDPLPNGHEWRVTIPTRRPDISLEADLVEEVARLVGYDSIPSTLPLGPTTVGGRNDAQKLRKRTREVLLGAGMIEVSTYSLTNPSDLDALRIPADSPYRQMIPLLKPMSEERTVLRTHMLPALAQVATYNLARGVTGGQIFEINRVYWPSSLPLTEQPCERTQWAGLWFGQTETTIGLQAHPFDFYDAKGVVETWLNALGWNAVEYRPIALSWLHPGRSAEVLLSGERIGTFGELHPETVQALELGSALYAEFDLDLLVKQVSDGWRTLKLPRFPASRRDLAVLVRSDVTVADLISLANQVARQSEAPILEACTVFDVYTGKGIAEGQKSLAFSLVYRSDERTLTDDEVTALETSILQAWSSAFGAVLRTS
jgi:phenylalanyl-tRNA synthetase beta chain